MRLNRGIRILIASAVVCALLAAGLLLFQQVSMSQDKTDSHMDDLLSYISKTFKNRYEQSYSIIHQFVVSTQKQLDFVTQSLNESDISLLAADKDENTLTLLKQYGDIFNNMLICLVDREGNILYNNHPVENSFIWEGIVRNLREDCVFTDEEWKRVQAGTSIYKENEDHSFDLAKIFTHKMPLDDYYTVCYVFSSCINDKNGEDTGYRLVVMQEETRLILAAIKYLGEDFIFHLDDSVSFLVVYDDYEYMFYSSVPKAFEKDKFGELNLDKDVLSDGFTGNRTLDGVSFRLKSIRIPTNGFSTSTSELIVIAIQKNGISVQTTYIVWDCVVFLFAALFFIFYCFFSFKDNPNSEIVQKWIFIGSVKLNRAKVSEFLPVGSLIVILTGIVCYLTTTMSCTSSAMGSMQTRQNGISDEISRSYYFQTFTTQFQDTNMQNAGQLFAAIIDEHADCYFHSENGNQKSPYYVLKQGVSFPVLDSSGVQIICNTECQKLKNAASMLGFTDASIYSSELLCLFTTLESKPEKLAEDSLMTDVLLRNKPRSILKNDDGTTSLLLPFYMYSISDNEGVIHYISRSNRQNLTKDEKDVLHRQEALLVLKSENSVESIWSAAAELLESETAFNISFILLQNDENHTALYIPSTFIGKTVHDLNLPNQLFQNAYYGFFNIEGNQYLLHSSKINSVEFDTTYWLISAVGANAIFDVRITSVVFSTVFTFVFIIIIILLFSSERFTFLLQDYSPDSVDSNVSSKWFKKSPSEKLGFVIHIASDLLILFCIVMYATKWGQNTHSVSATAWLFSWKWERGIHIFSIVGVILMSVVILTVSRFLSRILNMPYSFTSGRVETGLKIVGSVVRYSSILFVIFYSLYLFGMDTNKVFASLGVFSAVVGLGANKLIADIVAGIFIIFEGEFHVGDIVTIDNFCGKVTDIGIRTTKVENLDGNVNIFNNSNITKILNMSYKPSRIKIDLKVSRDISIETFEKCFHDHLPEICAKCKLPENSLSLLGVDEFNSVSNVFRIESSCNEIQRNYKYRILNRELLQMCKDHNIPIQ